MISFFAAIVAMTNMCGVVTVDTHGARVISYIPEGGEEVFFVSETGTGGMPLCWPWFAGNGPSKDSRRHGIARYKDFEVVGTERIGNDSTLTLQLKSDDETRRLFPHDFTLTVKVRMNDRLTVSMTGENTGKEPFAVTEAFHPYFAVSDSGKCIVEGIDSDECRLLDPSHGWTLSFADEGGKGRYIWRPNPKSHLSKSVSPILPDDWRRFICVENGTLKKEDAYILKPGECHTLTRVIRLTSTYDNAKPINLQDQIETVAKAGGGRVTVPAGEWFTKAVHLRSNVELHLDDNATLVFSDDPKDYLPTVRSSYSAIEFYGLSPLIYAYGVTNVSVTGGGVLTTRMALWRDWFLRDNAIMDENQRQLYYWGENDVPVDERRFKDPCKARVRPSFIEFERCCNVRLDGFRIRYSPLWCVHLRLCDGVHVSGLDIRARGHNNDGIDVNSSRNVLIENCTLDQGDDAFVIKSGRDRDGRRVGVPCENVTIRNCTVKRGVTLLGVGSEVSGGVRNILLHDCRITERANAMLRVKTSDRKGAYIENITVSNVTVTAEINHLISLITNLDYQWGRYPARERMLTRIDGVKVENVTADSALSIYALHGDSRLPTRNFTIRNVKAKTLRSENFSENVELDFVR
ncbi:MAG: right-handed parallel beta-helix repeat-containing protein [Kiritimatiellae bacterium]|nr:right-handed parallel beta-helix repeat-containing protein [Kiritimatiellia bacterium]